MSVEAITWALRQEIRRSSAKFVLVVLANCASGDTFVAWPSVAYLAGSTSQDRKTVLANLKKLASWGLIEDTGKRKGVTRQVPVYRLICDLPPRTAPDKPSRKWNRSENGIVPETDESSTDFPSKPIRKRDAEPSTIVIDPTTTRGTHATDVVAVDCIEKARVDQQTKQALRDELNARMAKNPPNKPISWVRALIKRAERGEFVSDAGLAVAARRRERDAREQEAAQHRQEAADREQRARSPEARAAADAALRELRDKLLGSHG